MKALIAATGVLVSLIVVAPAAADTSADRADAIARQLAAGVQVVPKSGVPVPGPDPTLAFLPDMSTVDMAGVRLAREQKAKARSRLTPAGPPARVYTEREPVGAHGVNDTNATADAVVGFGTGNGRNPKVTLLGDLAPDTNVPTLPAFAEDNGSLPLAGETGVANVRRAVNTSGTIGDGPHGSAGDGKGDFDFYKINGGTGVSTTAKFDITTPTSELDTVVALYNSSGQLLVLNDDKAAGTKDSQLTAPLRGGLDYYLLVTGFGPNGTTFPANPSDSASGTGVGSEGSYNLSIATGEAAGDQDFYAFDLKPGDVLGASVAGNAKRLAVYDSTGKEAFGSSQDATALYPANSPLPGGGNAVVDFVAPTAGRYTLAVEHGEGAYQVTLEAYRPGTETLPSGSVQTLFLDFNGARVNTAIFGGPGVRELSPLVGFLGRWGLEPSDEDAVIDAVVATTRESIERDLAGKGTNARFGVRILNSRDHADPFGNPNVTRLIVGGTVAEAGINTVGIAQSIDPGNFGHEETALILLDRMSAPAGSAVSLNTYLTPASNRIGFVGQAVGNVVAHETGHLSGSWHLDQFNDVASLMDQGGNPTVMFGVGPDAIGGTADDVDVDFIADTLNPTEGFTGTEDVLNRTAWAYVRA